jgi:hypothetical protein
MNIRLWKVSCRKRVCHNGDYIDVHSLILILLEQTCPIPSAFLRKEWWLTDEKSVNNR